MKITKILTEAEDFVNPAQDSTKEVAAEIANGAAEATGDKVKLTADQAQAAAKEVQDAGKTLKADTMVVADDDAPLVMKNRLTDALDDALAAAIDFKEEGIHEVANVLVSGLPGSSKTASVYNWAKQDHPELEPDANGERKVNIFYINAKNNDLQAYIDGYAVQDPDNRLQVTQAVSNNLKDLERPNSVLFLDEYNRQTKKNIRASVLTLINEHAVVGREEGGRHYFPNFLFTIAAINPAIGADDEGADPLIDAEKSRFVYKVKNFDSDPTITAQYLKEFYLNKVKRLAQAAEADPTNTKLVARIEKLLRIVDLGTFIVQHSSFYYDKLADTSKLSLQDRTMLNQRTLTAGLAACKGERDRLKRWVKGSSDFLDDDVEMLEDILDEYRVPTKDQLFVKYAKSANIALPGVNTAPATTATAAAEPEDDDKEDDTDLFGGNGNADSGNAIPNTDDTYKKIWSTIDSWG